jgi:hypothetical protein
VVRQLLAGRTAIGIVLGQINKIRFSQSGLPTWRPRYAAWAINRRGVPTPIGTLSH